MADYMASNDAVPELRAHIVETIRRRMAEAPEAAEVAEARLTDAVLGVREDYLDAAWRAIAQDYGSLSAYLDAAGITGEHVRRLRAALLG